jgi:hypothetical protein
MVVLVVVFFAIVVILLVLFPPSIHFCANVEGSFVSLVPFGFPFYVGLGALLLVLFPLVFPYVQVLKLASDMGHTSSCATFTITPPSDEQDFGPPIVCSPSWLFVVVVIVDVVFLIIATTPLSCCPLGFTFMQVLKLFHWSCSLISLFV